MSDVAQLYMQLTNSRTAAAIVGESTAADFPGQIELDRWSWSISTKDNQADGTLKSGLNVEPAVLTFSKLMDRSTTSMLAAMRNREPLTAVITLRDSSGVAFELKVTLKDVRVIDYRVNGKNDKLGGQIDENWTFNYSEVIFDFKPATTSGNKGVTKAAITRHAQASTDAPPTPSEEMIKLAEKLEEREWDLLMPRLTKIQETIASRTRPSDTAQGATR